MQGADVRKAREAIGWKRPQLAEATGLSVAQIASIESGRSIRPAEETVLRDVLQRSLDQAPVGNGKVPVSQPAALGPEDGPDPMPPAKQDAAFDPGIIVLEEWCGIKRGDIVRLESDPKPWDYAFIKYVKEPEREYVMCQRPGRASPRTVQPSNVLKLQIIKRKKEWVHAFDSSNG